MGFTAGFLGGATLTYSILYFSLSLHRANRSYQHTLLSQQSVLLNSVVEPLPPPPEPPAYTVKTAGLVEVLKDKWNAEVEGLVRRAQHTDWNQVRERVENGAGVVWRRLRESGGDEAAAKVKDKVAEVVDGVKEGAKETTEKAEQATRQPRLLELKE